MKLGISHPFSDLSRQQNFPLKGQRRRILGLHFSVALVFWWRTSWGNSTWDAAWRSRMVRISPSWADHSGGQPFATFPAKNCLLSLSQDTSRTGKVITSSDVFGEVSWRLTLCASGGGLCRALAGTPGRGEASGDWPGGMGSHPMPNSVQGMVWHGMVLRF